MSILTAPSEETATGLVAELFANDIRDQGYVSSHTRVLSLHPEALSAWDALITEIGRPMDTRRYELVTLAAALGARSRHCRVAHGRKSLRYIDEAQLIKIALDYRTAGLSDADVAMMEFAEQVSVDASAMTDAHSQRLRDVGFTDRDIVDIALAAAARNYFSRAIQALAIEVDVANDLSTPLREALVHGI